jgi:hypothetical protein
LPPKGAPISAFGNGSSKDIVRNMGKEVEDIGTLHRGDGKVEATLL